MPTKAFEIDIRPLGPGGVVVAITGEIDLFTTPEFKEAIGKALNWEADTLVVDLTRCTFVDSSSLGVLIGAHRRLVRRGRSLRVATNQEAILRVLRVTGLDGVFDVVEAVPDPERSPATLN